MSTDLSSSDNPLNQFNGVFGGTPLSANSITGLAGNITGGQVGNMLDPGNIGGAFGFQQPQNTPAGSSLGGADKAGYAALGAQAGNVFGTPINAPQATTPNWLQAPVTNATAAVAAPAPTVTGAVQKYANFDTSQGDQTAAGEQKLAAGLQQTAAGAGPSVAQEQLRQATAADINQQAAQAQAMHGAARLAALRSAQQTGAATQQTAASQASALRAQEIAAAQGNLGNVLGAERGADITQATVAANLQQGTNANNAGFQQGANLANAGFGEQTNLANAGFVQGANLTNAGAANTSANNFATQSNAGNLQIQGLDVGSDLQTNALNTQRTQNMLTDEYGGLSGSTGIDTTLFGGETSYNTGKQQLVGGLLNPAGQGAASSGSSGSGGSDGLGGISSLGGMSDVGALL